MNLKAKMIKHHKKILISVLVISVVFAALQLALKDRDIKTLVNDTVITENVQKESVAQDGTNSSDPASSESKAEELPEPKPVASSSQDNANQVVVVITSVSETGSTISVRGYVEGVVESDGICTFSLIDSSGNTIVTTARQSVANATSTSCGKGELDISNVKSGSYLVRLSYSSDKVSASYAQEEVTL